MSGEGRFYVHEVYLIRANRITTLRVRGALFHRINGLHDVVQFSFGELANKVKDRSIKSDHHTTQKRKVGGYHLEDLEKIVNSLNPVF